MEVWQISILKRFHWPIWHPFLKKSSQDSGNHQKERGERHFVLPMVSRCKKKCEGQAVAMKFHSKTIKTNGLSWPSTFPTADLHCTVHKERLGLRYWRVSRCGLIGDSGERDGANGEAKPSNFYSVSKVCQSFKTKNCQQVMVSSLLSDRATLYWYECNRVYIYVYIYMLYTHWNLSSSPRPNLIPDTLILAIRERPTPKLPRDCSQGIDSRLHGRTWLNIPSNHWNYKSWITTWAQHVLWTIYVSLWLKTT